MGTIILFFNAIAYFLLFYLNWRKNKQVDIYFFLTFLYAFTAIMCFLYYQEVPSEYPNIGIIAFVYLFFALMMFMAPIRTFDIRKKTLNIIDNRYFLILALIFLVFSAYDIVTSFAHTEEIIKSGAYEELRNMGYTDPDMVELYSDQYQRLAKNVDSYLKPFALVYAFFQLTKPNPNKLLVISLFIAIIVPSFIGAVADASRGMIIAVLLQLVVAYLLFKNNIPVERKKYFYIGSLVVLSGFVIYTIAVTLSRFGDDSGNSVFMYLGHSMLVFNDGIFYNMTQYSWGGKFLDFFVDMFGLQSFFPKAIGATHPKAFCTIIGSLYTDFGPAGTLCMAVLAQLIIKRYFYTKEIKMSDAIMIVFYSTTIANGIMVSPRGRALTWIMTFVVYFIVRILEKKSKKVYIIKKNCYA